MNKKVFPVEEVRKYAEQGLSIDKIAEIYHTSRPTMGKFLRENDIDTERKTHVKFCAELDDNIGNLSFFFKRKYQLYCEL